jgi:hypothetical protein
MIEKKFLNVLRKIHNRLQDRQFNWAVTGSLGMALQGMDLVVHDIDIQTDQQGAYAIEKLFANSVVVPVYFRESERIRSHYGALEIDGIKVEIMGDLQKRLDDQAWEDPVEVEHWRRWVEIDGMRIPVLSLEYEYQAYIHLGRTEKAQMLRNWLDRTRGH